MRVGRTIGLAALTPLSFGLLALCALDPALTERFFSRGWYPHVERALTGLARLSPIAIGETLLLLATALASLRLTRGIVAWRRRRRSLRNLCAHAVSQSLATLGVLVFVFMLGWGINHARMPFATQVGLVASPAEPSRLARVARRLADRALAVRPTDFDSDARSLPDDWHERIADAYDAAGSTWPVLLGPRPVIRTPWISRVMTLASITGIYSPFTGEPNENGHLLDVQRPFVACHEVAHLRGYAREDEANFIAWWVGSRSSDRAVAYSCELTAYMIAMTQLYGVDPVAWATLRESVPEPVRRDHDAIRRFWFGQPAIASRVLTSITRTTNDLYLKSSGHAEGVQSYGRMVDLLIAALPD